MTQPLTKPVFSLLGVTLILSFSLVRAQDRNADDLYHDYCSVCHGDTGDGNSHARQGLIPPPRNFTTPESSVYLTRDRMIQSISEGIPGTAMTPWNSQLSTSEIENVTDLIRNRFMLSATADDASRGRKIYAEYCSVCHGDAGKGAMWAMQGLSPSPANFTDPKVIKSLNRNDMIQAVTFGRVETAMTGWTDRLNSSDVEAVVDYIMIGFMGIDDAEMGTGMGTSTAEMDAPLPKNLKGDVNAGFGLYTANCATCHGDVGDGRGPRAYFINPKPRNFTHTASRAVLNRPALFQAVSKGRLYSEMPAWDKVLSDQKIADVAEYVFQQFIQQSSR